MPAQLDRRGLILNAALIGAAVAGAGAAQAQPAAGPAPYAPQPRPLPFDPASVPGLSAKLLTSHHDNNYAGAVKRIAAITAEFAGLDPATAAGYRLNGLKREELLAWNSMMLHEVYFASISGVASTPSPALQRMIERDFGSQARWAAEFTGMGKALGGGSGWVLLMWSPRDGRLVNQWAADHTMTLAAGTPLLALDMYEHAYHMDYSANAGGYVEAYMKAISWRHANETLPTGR